MGNFYTNIALRTTKRQELIEYMREQGRAGFVSPISCGFTTVYDRLCDEQDVRDLETLATELSSRFSCSAFAVLNHDDDFLWIGVARDGNWVTTYRSDEVVSGNAWKLARGMGVLGLLPLIWVMMRWPFVLFEMWRHRAITGALGIPDFTVGFGYRYLARGERPAGANPEEFESV